MSETSELVGGRLTVIEPKNLETEQKSLYDFIDQKFVPWSQKAKFAIKIDDGRLVGPFNTFLYSPQVSTAVHLSSQAETAVQYADTRECAKSSPSPVVHSWNATVRTLCPLSASSQSWPFGTVHPSFSQDRAAISWRH